MIDLLKKTLLAGIGVTLMTKDRAEELAREFARSAQLSADKGQEFIDQAVARAQQGRAEAEQLMQRMIDDGLRRANVATKAELDRLAARVEALEQRLPGPQ